MGAGVLRVGTRGVDLTMLGMGVGAGGGAAFRRGLLSSVRLLRDILLEISPKITMCLEGELTCSFPFAVSSLSFSFLSPFVMVG